MSQLQFKFRFTSGACLHFQHQFSAGCVPAEAARSCARSVCLLCSMVHTTRSKICARCTCSAVLSRAAWMREHYFGAKGKPVKRTRVVGTAFACFPCYLFYACYFCWALSQCKLPVQLQRWREGLVLENLVWLGQPLLLCYLCSCCTHTAERIVHFFCSLGLEGLVLPCSHHLALL